MPAITGIPDDELTSLYARDQREAVEHLITAMQLGGARVGPGDLTHALGRLGLRLTTIEGADPEARLAAAIETRDCPCGSTWARYPDAEGPGAGWRHLDPENGWAWVRKCDEGHRPLPRQL